MNYDFYIQLSAAQVSLAALRLLLASDTTTADWDGSASRWSSAQDYCACCLVDENEPDSEPVKAKCYFPYKEPGSGKVNLNALKSIQALINTAKIPAAKRQKAAQKTVKMMLEHGLEPTENLKAVAEN